MVQPGRIPHPFASDGERRRLVTVGELTYNRAKLVEAVTWIQYNPTRFASLTAGRMVRFWFPPARRRVLGLSFGGAVFPAFLGLVQAWRKRALIAWWVTLVWVCYPLAYHLIQADPRYPYPLYWILLLMAADWTAGLLHHAPNGRNLIRRMAPGGPPGCQGFRWNE